MKILILGTAYPLRGAMAQLNAILGWHLSKKHDVEIVSFKRQYPSLFFPGKTQFDPSKPLFPLPTTVILDSINPLSWYNTARIIAQRQPHLVIMRYWMPFFAPCFGTIARLVKRWSDATVVCICDNVIPHERRPGDRWLTRYFFRSVDRFIVQSKAVEQDLLAFYPQARYLLVSHPVYDVFGVAVSKDDARKKMGITSERVVLFFGYIRRYKGLHLLIDAMKLVNESLPVKALVVGEFYEDEKPYREHITHAGVEQSVQLVPEYVPNEKVADYFSAADVVVLPYLSATQSGITQIAYNFGKPVIATDVGGLAEVVVDGVSGLVVPPNDPRKFADAIVKFYNEDLEETLAAGSRQEKKKYSWDTMVEAIESLVVR